METMRQYLESRNKSNRGVTTEVERLRKLIITMDENRTGLGDACRVCNARVWAGANGVRRPHHKRGCPIASIIIEGVAS